MEQPLEAGAATAPAAATPAPRLEHSRTASAGAAHAAEGSHTGRPAHWRQGKLAQAASQAGGKVLGAFARVLKNLLPDEGTLRLPPRGDDLLCPGGTTGAGDRRWDGLHPARPFPAVPALLSGGGRCWLRRQPRRPTRRCSARAGSGCWNNWIRPNITRSRPTCRPALSG